MDISAIIEMVMALIEKCMNQSGKEATKGRMRNFGKGEGEIAVRLHLRSIGLKRPEINGIIDELKVASATATEADIDNLLASVGSPQWKGNP